MDYMVMDIETIPCQSIPQECIPQFDASSVNTGYLKDPFKIRDKVQEAKSKFETDLSKKMSLDPDLCQVCACAIGDEVLGDEAGEHELIYEAWNVIRKACQASLPLVSFNGISFDIPILVRRAMYLDIAVNADMIDALLAPYNNRRHIDLMRVLGQRNPFSGKMEFKKLNYYLQRFSLETKTEGWDGSMVYPAWQEGRIDEIKAYCLQDVKSTAALFERVAPWIMAKTSSQQLIDGKAAA